MVKYLNISSCLLVLLTIGTVVLCNGEDTAGSGDVAAKPLVCQAHEFSCLDGTQCIPDVQECDGLDDCGDSSDEGSHCQFFTCGDGTTVNSMFLCDGFSDCIDESDESEEANCTKFECENGKKISPNRRCDGFNDCDDEFQSDECGCDDSFTCNNQKCIQSYFKCDGVDDCGDNSDELMCDAFTVFPAKEAKVDVSEVFKSPASFQCRNSKAVDSSLKCNGVDDCGDSSDECDCEDRFVCDNGRCIDMKLAGNGIDDCGDDSDEEVVTTTTESPIVVVTTVAGNTQHVTNEPGVVSTTSETPKPSTDVTTSEVSIAQDTFTCNNGRLINTSVLCDGTDDCMDEFRSDECNCARSFMCSNKRCIDDHLVCDSVDDCGDCSDEIGCVDSNHESLAMYFCHKGSCIRNSKVCDGHDDCVNGDDEFNCEAIVDVTTTTSSRTTTKKVIEEVLTEGTKIDVIEGSVDVTETDEKEIDVTIKHVDVTSVTPTTITTKHKVEAGASDKKTEKEEEKFNPSEKDAQGPGGDAVFVTSHIMTIAPAVVLLFTKLFIP